MEVFLIRLIQFILSISLLVLLHEGGHMFFAKLFGVRVEKFFIFFDVSIGKWKGALFSWKPKNSDTEYGMGWLPLGGYCKIAGMIDESFDTDQMAKPAQPWEFRTKPAWQRLLIMIGGVTVNFVLALFIYSMIMFHWGDTYYKVADMSMGMTFNSQAKQLGFKDGDVLLGTDKRAFKDFNGDMFRDLSKAHRVDIIRNGKKMSINLPGNINLLDMVKAQPAFVRPYVPAVIKGLSTDYPEIAKSMKTDKYGIPALKMGMKAGDRIVAFNGKPVSSWNDIDDAISSLQQKMENATTSQDSMKVRSVTLAFTHKGAKDTLVRRAVLTPELAIGVARSTIMDYYKPTHVDYGFLQSFPAGIAYGWDVLKGYVSDMQYVFSSEGVKSLGGFGAIGGLFPAEWNWYKFWRMTAFLSIILAFMNILPIPALDGGHVLFLLYEMITRRKPSEKFMIRAEYIGISFLLILMVVANLNDILRWLGLM